MSEQHQTRLDRFLERLARRLRVILLAILKGVKDCISLALGAVGYALGIWVVNVLLIKIEELTFVTIWSVVFVVMVLGQAFFGSKTKED